MGKYRKPAVTNTTSSTQKNLRYPSQPNSVIPSARYQSPTRPPSTKHSIPSHQIPKQQIPQQIPQQVRQPIRQPLNIQQTSSAQNSQYLQNPISSNMIRQVQPGQPTNQTSSISSNQSSSIPVDLPVPLLPTNMTSPFSSTKVQNPVDPSQQSANSTGPSN